MKNPVKGGFYAFQSMDFTPRVRVIGRYRCRFFDRDMVVCVVTGKDEAHKYHGYRTGQVTHERLHSLYRSRRVLRGTFGQLEYFNPVTRAEYLALPEVAP